MSLAWYEWNPFMFKKLVPYIKDDWIFVDVGSNRGEFIDFFKTFKYKKIYAFELNPEMINILKNKYADQPNIIIENSIVCHINGTSPFFDGGEHADNACYNIIGHNMNFEKTKKLGTIKSIRLDTYFSDMKIDLVKIDVEGAELMVLEGLKSIINSISYMLIECHLDKDWNFLKNILLNDLKFHCINFYDDSIVTENSNRPYQCFCKKI